MAQSHDWRLPEPQEVASLSPDALPGLLTEVSALLAAIGARLVVVERPAPIDEPLPASEAARRLGVTEDYLRRHPDRFPGCPLWVGEGTVRYSSHGIEQLKKRLRSRDLSSSRDTALLPTPRIRRGRGEH